MLARISFLVILTLAACSSAKVRGLPGEDGIHRVVSRDIEKDDAEEAAMDEAKEFCDDQKKMMYVVKEETTKYQGSMEEETRKTVRNASKAAVILGGAAGSSAGQVGYAMTGDRDYEAQFTFRCK